MEALKSDSSLVTPGNPDTSTLFTVYLRPARPMGQRLGADAETIKTWIREGCPIPSEENSAPKVSEKLGPITSTLRVSDYGKLTRAEQFHVMLNIEDHPGFLPYAKELAREFFLGAKYDDAALYAKFEYDDFAFDNRMEAIYNDTVANMYPKLPAHAVQTRFATGCIASPCRCRAGVD